MSTIAQQLHQQDIEQSRAEGMDEMEKMARNIARKLLMQQVASLETIAHMTNLPVSDVIAIQKDIKEEC